MSASGPSGPLVIMMCYICILLTCQINIVILILPEENESFGNRGQIMFLQMINISLKTKLISDMKLYIS